MWPDVQEQVEVEVEQLRQLLVIYRGVVSDAAEATPGFIEVSAMATMLHSFYTGIENIFKRIAIGIDTELPAGALWHSALLDTMAQRSAARPAVITVETRSRLKEYLSFRHVFRQAYSFDLQWGKMAHLVLGCESVYAQLVSELNLFFQTT